MAIVRRYKDPFLDKESAIKALQGFINGTKISREGMYLLQIIDTLVQDEKEIYQRIPSEVFGGLAEGGRRNVQASALCRAEGSPDGAKPQDVLESGYTREQEIINFWAVRDGCWSDAPENDLKRKGFRHQSKFDGSEAQVFFSDTKKVYKAIDFGRYPNMQRFLDRVTIHNAYFPECPMTVEGFGLKDTSIENSRFCAIISQPFVEGTTPTEEQIADALHARGLEDPMFGAGFFYVSPSGNLMVTDVHDRNCVLTPEGRIAVFDCEAMVNNIENFGGKFRIPDIQYTDKSVEKIQDYVREFAPLSLDRDSVLNLVIPEMRKEVKEQLENTGRVDGPVKTKSGRIVILQQDPQGKDKILVSRPDKIRKMFSFGPVRLDDGTVLNENTINKLVSGQHIKTGKSIMFFDLDKGRVNIKNNMKLNLYLQTVPVTIPVEREKRSKSMKL